jgi:hypothetical protein
MIIFGHQLSCDDVGNQFFLTFGCNADSSFVVP